MMNVITLPLSELKRPERNVRIHTDKQLKEFERSIRMFGQIRPLVVDETNTILAGVGCYETLCRMGAAEASVYKVENLTENQKKKLMIADNKIYGLGVDNLDTFNSFLEELSSDLDIPGFDESILQSMVAEAEEVTDKIMEYGTVDDSEIEAMQQRSYVEPDGSAVVFPGPYARMQYMGVAMVDRETGRGPMMIPQGAGGDYVFRFRKGAKLVATDRPLHYSSPTAEAKWFEVAKDLNGDYWIKEVKRIGGGG